MKKVLTTLLTLCAVATVAKADVLNVAVSATAGGEILLSDGATPAPDNLSVRVGILVGDPTSEGSLAGILANSFLEFGSVAVGDGVGDAP
ncbi:MAG: hypothetical protein AAGA58_02490, partial [Verrucomicrobiota bacterium]